MPIIEGRDTIISGPEHSGRTLALLIGMLNLIEPKSKKLQAIVLQSSNSLDRDLVNKVNLLGKYLGVRAATENLQLKRGGYQIAIIPEARIKQVLSNTK